jgi:cytochrome c556
MIIALRGTLSRMRNLLVALALVSVAAVAQAPTYENVGTMSQLMINIIFPTSDALFYIERNAPKNDVDWNIVKNNAMTLAESGNLLMMPGRARDQDEWVKDSRWMIEVASKAYKAAQAKNMQGILDLSEDLANTCIKCHLKYRPGYGRGRTPQQR